MTTETNHAEQQASAQMESITQMVAALSVDWDRLEELRTMAKTPRYVAGFNMPGYLPDSEPAEFDNAEDARAYIAEEMRNTAECTDEQLGILGDDAEDHDKAEAERDELRLLADELENLATSGAGAEFGRTVGEYHYWITCDGFMLQGADVEELAELETAAGDATDDDSAREILEQDALSVEVRSGWHSMGETLEAAEFCILLCTGGPAVRIVGDLDEHGTPSRPRLEYQDWGTPWTEYHDVDRDALLAYCEAYLGGY